jgi:membrane protease subunit HflK
MYLESMERLLGGKEKVIMDAENQGVVPYLPLRELSPQQRQPQQQQQQQQGGTR